MQSALSLGDGLAVELEGGVEVFDVVGTVSAWVELGGWWLGGSIVLAAVSFGIVNVFSVLLGGSFVLSTIFGGSVNGFSVLVVGCPFVGCSSFCAGSAAQIDARLGIELTSKSLVLIVSWSGKPYMR